VARLLQTLSSCRTEYFGRLGMVKVSFGSKADLEEMSASGAKQPLIRASRSGEAKLYRYFNNI
jgi:hypothetical protein